MAYCLILSLFVLVKAVADSASSIILLTSGTEVERSLFRRFFFLPQPPPLPTGTPSFEHQPSHLQQTPTIEPYCRRCMRAARKHV
jgi:hypothetical protein